MYFRFLMTGIAASIISTSAFAQHGHSDVEFGYNNNAITILFGDEGRVFEGEFPPDTSFLARNTDDPGFAADEPNPDPNEASFPLLVGPNDVIGYNIYEGLFYWDGTQELAPAIAASITITDRLGSFVLDGSSVESLSTPESPSGSSQILSFADGGGVVHDHMDFDLSGSAPQGAYGILMSLSTNASGIADSKTFGIVFNFGLDEEDFEAGVAHFVVTRNLVTIPEPGTTIALASLMVPVLLRRRR